MGKVWQGRFLGVFGVLVAVVLFSSIILFPTAVSGQSQYAENWKYIVNRDYVNDIAIYEGTLWQGINGGLVARSLSGPAASRYYHKLNSGLEASRVLSVAVDDSGNVWAGTDRGVFRRSVNGVWSTFNMDNSPLTVNTVRFVLPDEQGGVWLGTWLGGAYYLDSEGEWNVYKTENSGIPGNRIYTIVPDGNGGVWFGTDTRGAAYLDEDGEWTVYRSGNSDLPSNDVQDIQIDNQGRVWFATMSGLVSLDADGEWEIYDLLNSQIPSEIVNSLTMDDDGNIWMGTNGGLTRLQVEDSTTNWLTFTTVNSRLPAQVVRSVAIDEGGTVWAGTWGGSIAGLNPNNFSWRVYGHEMVSLPGRSYLPSNTVNNVLSFPGGNDFGTVWFATGEGVAYYDATAEKWDRFNTDNRKLPVNLVNGMARDSQGNIAFATEGGGLAVKSAAGAWQYYNRENSDLPSDDLIYVTYDQDDGLWLVTLAGRAVYRSAAGDWKVYDPAEDNMPEGEYRLNSVYNDGAGNTWFGTWGGGAVQLDAAGNWSAYKVRTSGISANDVSKVVTDGEGNTWFGTWGGGVARLSSEGTWDVFNRDNSELPSNIMRDVVMDNRGWIWVATPLGVAYHDGENWQAMRSRDSGLPINSIWNMDTDTFGNVWFSTNENGVAVYNPDGVMDALAVFSDITERHRESIILFEGKYLVSDVAPTMESGRVLLPMRPLATAMGAALDWDGTGSVEMTLGDKIVELQINDTRAYIDGQLYTLDVPARLRDGRTMIPVRFVSESLGLNVTWDSVIGAALLTK